MPDRCNQNFDKTTDKIKNFVKSKIVEWVNEEEEVERLRKESIQKREQEEKNKLLKLMDLF